jgi:transposase-like protein
VIAAIGFIPQTLRAGVMQAEKNSGLRGDVTTHERRRIKALERESRELRQTNEIMHKAPAYLAPSSGDVHIACRPTERNRTTRSSDERLH